ncbi:hypothetical protein PTSG_06382 [Salpingoeca rosetta]|uniref:Phytanoyl-CoA dioxygenase n=1 Tax=Salpingoeca rosetta (strain ATCC 50818 / BSB-021) TaxID=946362 RepID=F2UCR4_SALR5|nr:uncharacterized protein PTSG_06382 [Salpingoeca rosetta]EGD74371.1 hypothetical protein PTSG_06382 [Salpingoeca rosetta]|eukprot:XP_004993271.1 hypothetical protein PTSG_06382 [Salpingoeca rosetta]
MMMVPHLRTAAAGAGAAAAAAARAICRRRGTAGLVSTARCMMTSPSAYQQQQQPQPRSLGFLTQEQANFHDTNGYLVIDGFFDQAACDDMRAACTDIVSSYDPQKEDLSTFSTVDQQGNAYFLESGDKIRYFFEEGAVDEQRNIVVDIDRAFNKIGHALHFLNPVFKKYTFDPRIKAIAHDLGLVEPAIPQSMYIFKQPGIGGEVVPHQDSTFLYTEPLSTTGFWIPLQVVHRSSANRSDRSRHAYTFHVIETKNTTYPEDNWLQTPAPFPRL